MSESFKPNHAEVMASNDVPAELKNKLSLMDKMKSVGSIDDNTDVAEEWTARVDEAMAEYNIAPGSRDLTESLVAIEYTLASNPESRSEMIDYMDEIARDALVGEFPSIGDDEIEAFKATVVMKLDEGLPFANAFHEALKTRKEIMNQTKGFNVSVDSEGVVYRDQPGV